MTVGWVAFASTPFLSVAESGFGNYEVVRMVFGTGAGSLRAGGMVWVWRRLGC